MSDDSRAEARIHELGREVAYERAKREAAERLMDEFQRKNLRLLEQCGERDNALKAAEARVKALEAEVEPYGQPILTLPDKHPLRIRAEQAEAREQQLAAEVGRLRAAQPLLDELARAETKFPTWPCDIVHAAAVVAEEAGELVQAALQLTYEHSTLDAVKKEAIQTGAMALRFLLMFDKLSPRQSLQVRRADLAPEGRKETQKPR